MSVPSDVVSPTQAPSKRLKKTCDHCTNSKVKCDRARPACSRCGENDFICHYSETRRVGRPRRVQTTSQAAPTSTEQLEQPYEFPTSTGDTLGFPPTAMEDADLFDYVLSLSAPLDPKYMPDSQHPLSIPVGDSDVQGLSTELGQLRGGPSRSSSDDYLTDASTTSHIGSSHPHSSAPTFDFSTPTILPQHSKGASCIRQALSTLESLTFTCQRAEQFKTTTIVGIDGALQANRAAVALVQDVMKCMSCADNASVVLVLALVMQQGMHILWGILHTRHDEEESAIFNVPLAIGGYTLTGDARSKVIKQVLQDEMVELSKVLESIQACPARAEDEHLVRSRDVLVKSTRARIEEARSLLGPR